MAKQPYFIYIFDFDSSLKGKFGNHCTKYEVPLSKNQEELVLRALRQILKAFEINL